MTLHRFLIRLIWVCIAPLILLTVFLAAMHVRTLSVQQNREAGDRVRNVAVALDHNLGARIKALQVLSGSPLMDEPLRLKEFYQVAQMYQQHFGSHVIVANTSSQALLNTRTAFGAPLFKLPVPKGRSAVAIAIATGNPAVGDLFYGQLAKQPLVAITVPVIRNGAIRALLLTTVEVQQLKKRLDEVALPAGWTLTLFDSSQSLMAQRSPYSATTPSVVSTVPGHFAVQLSEVPWTVVLEVPQDIYRSPLVSAVSALAVAIITVTLVSIAGGRLAARRLSHSMATLTHETPAFGDGTILAEIEEVRTILQKLSSDRDISEQALRESEAQLKLAAFSLERRVQERTTELETANRELEAFSYSVSHDLRAPLRAIDGFSLAILEDYQDRLDEEGRLYLERIRKASQRMGVLIDDLLQLSRIGRCELQRELLDLSSLAREVADELTAREPDRQVVWQIEAGICLQADSNLMKITLTNLLDNALKFSSGREQTRISIGRACWSGQQSICIADNGAGFDPAYVDKLFSPFQRLHSDNEFPGTGIGLAIVQRIVHRHGWSVGAEATVDGGARFYFTIEDNTHG